jgi:hypothetical protein
VSQLFTQNVIRTLLNNAGNENNYLHKASVHAVCQWHHVLTSLCPEVMT